MMRAFAAAVLLAIAGCTNGVPTSPSDTPVLRSYGHGFPWSGYQQPHRARTH